MKIAVIGGTGLIGSQVVENLNAAGHEAVPHSLSTGVDVVSGQGVDRAVEGADVVVNLRNSPTFDDASLAFFEASMGNLLAAAGDGGVGHFVILSIVGVDKVPGLDYYRSPRDSRAIFSWSLRIPWSSASGRGGQPGT